MMQCRLMWADVHSSELFVHATQETGGYHGYERLGLASCLSSADDRRFVTAHWTGILPTDEVSLRNVDGSPAFSAKPSDLWGDANTRTKPDVSISKPKPITYASWHAYKSLIHDCPFLLVIDRRRCCRQHVSCMRDEYASR